MKSNLQIMNLGECADGWNEFSCEVIIDEGWALGLANCINEKRWSNNDN